jgi:hypothetical protein
LQVPPAHKHDQAQQHKPADYPMLSTLYGKFDVGQHRGYDRYKQGHVNPESKAIVEKSNQFLLLEMMTADWMTFGVDQ